MRADTTSSHGILTILLSRRVLDANDIERGHATPSAISIRPDCSSPALTFGMAPPPHANQIANPAVHCASRKFLDNLEEVINSDATSPVVRERLLDVLASAAYEFGKKPGKEGFATTWRRVRPSWKPPEVRHRRLIYCSLLLT